MIRYYKDFSLALAEIEGSRSLSIYTLAGCNLNCFQCLNRPIFKGQQEYKTVEDITQYIRQSGNLFDIIIFSGNELLLSPIEDIQIDLKQLRQTTDKPIILYTNGTFPDKMRALHEEGLVDGFHTDIKLPWLLVEESEDEDLIKLTVGVSLDKKQIADIIDSIEYTVEIDKGYNQLRTVKYPFLEKEAIDEIRHWVEQLNKKYNKNTPYKANAFTSLSEVGM